MSILIGMTTKILEEFTVNTADAATEPIPGWPNASRR